MVKPQRTAFQCRNGPWIVGRAVAEKGVDQRRFGCSVLCACHQRQHRRQARVEILHRVARIDRAELEGRADTVAPPRQHADPVDFGLDLAVSRIGLAARTQHRHDFLLRDRAESAGAGASAVALGDVVGQLDIAANGPALQKPRRRGAFPRDDPQHGIARGPSGRIADRRDPVKGSRGQREIADQAEEPPEFAVGLQLLHPRRVKLQRARVPVRWPLGDVAFGDWFFLPLLLGDLFGGRGIHRGGSDVELVQQEQLAQDLAKGGRYQVMRVAAALRALPQPRVAKRRRPRARHVGREFLRQPRDFGRPFTDDGGGGLRLGDRQVHRHQFRRRVIGRPGRVVGRFCGTQLAIGRLQHRGVPRVERLCRGDHLFHQSALPGVAADDRQALDQRPLDLAGNGDLSRQVRNARCGRRNGDLRRFGVAIGGKPFRQFGEILVGRTGHDMLPQPVDTRAIGVVRDACPVPQNPAILRDGAGICHLRPRHRLSSILADRQDLHTQVVRGQTA